MKVTTKAMMMVWSSVCCVSIQNNRAWQPSCWPLCTISQPCFPLLVAVNKKKRKKKDKKAGSKRDKKKKKSSRRELRVDENSSDAEETEAMVRRSSIEKTNQTARAASAVMNTAVHADPTHCSENDMVVHAMNQHAQQEFAQNADQMQVVSARIKEAMRQLWKTVKFVRSQGSEKLLAIKVAKLIDPDNFSDNEEATDDQKKNLDTFVNAYAEECTKNLNDLRSYVGNRIKEACTKYADDHEGKWPTIEMIQKCVERTIDLEDDDEKEFWFWYVEKAIGTACASHRDWSEDQRHFALLSTSAPPNNPDKVDVTKSTEAFFYLCCDNGLKKWEAMREVKKKNPNKKITHLYKDENEQEATQDKVSGVTVCRFFFFAHLSHCISNLALLFLYFGSQIVVGELTNNKPFHKPDRVYVMGPTYKGRYTDTRAGKNRFLGWTKNGIDVFNGTRAKVKDARAKDDCTVLEEAAKDYMREKNGITADTLEEYRKSKRAKSLNENETEAEIQECFDSDGE